VVVLSKPEELFCQLVVEGKDYTESYRLAYKSKVDGKKKWKTESISVYASRLANSDKIQLRISEIKAENAKDIRLSRQDVLKRLLKIVDSDGVKYKGSDVVKTWELIMKMCGMDGPELTGGGTTEQTQATLGGVMESLKKSQYVYDASADDETGGAGDES
jgi:hypothetical protein